MNQRTEALVIGEGRAALAVVRSLGCQGIPVAVAGYSASTLAGASRYASRRIVVPHPFMDPDGLAQALRDEARKNPGRVWIPVTDEMLAVVDGIRDSLIEIGDIRFPFPPSEVLELAWNKAKLVEFASVCGLHAPRTARPRHAREAVEEALSLGFPVVLKPARSKLRTKNGFREGRVRIIRDQKELISAWNREHDNIPFPLLQENIPGHGEGVFILADGGRVVARFAHRRIREKPPSGGVSVLRESVPVPEILIEPVDRLVQALGWHGVCMIEFRIDARDGKPYLMEINPRFWGSLQLAVDSGVDFPHLLYRLALGEKPEPVLNYRNGIRSRWLLGDLDHLLIRLKHRSGHHDLSSKSVGKFHALLKFLNPVGGKQEVFRWNDMKPAWVELMKYTGWLK